MHRSPVVHHLHDVAPAAQGGDRDSGAERLGEHGQVGRDAEHPLGAARRDAEPGQHLVEDQERAGVRGQLAHPLEVAGRGHDRAAVAQDRLGDHRGDLGAVLGEDALERGRVVPCADDQGARDRRRHAVRPWRRRGRIGRAPLGRPGMARPVDRVRPAVVVALEAEDLLPAGERAGEPDRVLHALRAGVAEPQQVDRRHPLGHGRRGLALEIVGEREERAALAQRLGDRVDDGGRAVAQDQRALAHHVVDEVVAVLVGDVRALAAAHEDGHGQVAGTVRAGAGADTARDAPGGEIVELRGAGRRRGDVGIAHALASSSSSSSQAP